MCAAIMGLGSFEHGLSPLPYCYHPFPRPSSHVRGERQGRTFPRPQSLLKQVQMAWTWSILDPPPPWRGLSFPPPLLGESSGIAAS